MKKRIQQYTPKETRYFLQIPVVVHLSKKRRFVNGKLNLWS